MFGLLFMILLGTIIIVLSITLESWSGFLQRQFHFDPYPHLEWRMDHMLQLQRLAYEEMGVQWHLGPWNTPILDTDTLLPVLDVNNDKLPTLSREKTGGTDIKDPVENVENIGSCASKD